MLKYQHSRTQWKNQVLSIKKTSCNSKVNHPYLCSLIMQPSLVPLSAQLTAVQRMEESGLQTRNSIGGSRFRIAMIPPHCPIYISQEMFDSISDVEREHVFPTKTGNKKGQRS